MPKGLTLYPSDPVDFGELLRLLHDQNYTGSIVVHCRGGTPVFVDTGRPHRITLRLPSKPRRLTQEDVPPHTPTE